MLMTKSDAQSIFSVVDAIANMQNDLQQRALLNSLISTLRSGSRLAMIGTGKTFSLLNRAESTARSLGLDCTAFCSNTLAHGDFGGLVSTDIQLFISKSGTTKEIVQSAKYAMNVLGLPQSGLIGLTCQEQDIGLNAILTNTLVLPLESELSTPTGCNIAPTLSSIAFSLVLDLIMTKASKLNNAGFKRLHPGGAIGTNI